MSLFTMIHVAANSMAAHRATTATSAHNIENVNTPGYSRQRAHLKSINGGRQVGGAAAGDGVKVANVNQVRDPFTEAQIPKYKADYGFGSSLTHVLKAVSVFDPSEPGNMVDSVGNY